MKLSGAPVHPYTRALVHPCARALVHLCKPKASLPSSHLSTPLGAVFRGGWTGKRASREIGNLKLLGVPVYLCARTPVYLCKSKASMLLSPPCLPSRPPWRSGGQVNGSKGTRPTRIRRTAQPLGETEYPRPQGTDILNKIKEDKKKWQTKSLECE